MDFREWHWAWTGRAKMEGWGPGAASSGRKESSIDMYNNDVGKKFMKQTGALKDATLYFASQES